jgi:acyl carrier protein
MSRDDIRSSLETIFTKVFEVTQVSITDATTAKDVKGWNSVSHIDMICAVEDQFRITFSTADIARLQNVGDLLDMISAKAAK